MSLARSIAWTCAPSSNPLKTSLSKCKNILSVSRDGRFAVVGDGGKTHNLNSYGDRLDDPLPIRVDSHEHFYRVEIATGHSTLIGSRELLGMTISQDARVVCGSAPSAFHAAGPARLVCLRDGQAADYEVPAAADPKRGWRSLSISPDGDKLAISLEASAAAKHDSLVHVMKIDGAGGELLLSERMRASSLIWLPSGRRLFVTPDNATARLYDLEAGWSVPIGSPGQEVSGLIPLGSQDDRFLVGVERKNTRDMWMVELPR